MPTHRIQHEFTTPSNETVISVEAEHKPGILSIDAVRNADSITCTPLRISLTFPTVVQAEQFHKVATERTTLVTASTLVGCTASSVRFLTGVSLIGTIVELQTKPATIHDAFNSVKVSAQIQPAELQVVTSSCTRMKILNGDCTALMNTSHLYTVSKDYSGMPLFHAGPVSLTCASCKVSLTSSIHFVLQITDNTLLYAGMAAGGNIDIDIGATLNATQKYSSNWKILLTKWSLPGVTFFLGAVPVDLVLQPQVDSYGGFEVNGTLSTSFQAKVSASQYSGLVWYRHGGWAPINQTKWSAELTKRAASGTVGGEAYNGLLIGFNAVINNIFTLTLSADAGLYMSAEDFHGAKYSGYVGLCEHVDLIADLGITLFGVRMGPHITWNIRNLYRHCGLLWEGHARQGRRATLETSHTTALMLKSKHLPS